MTQAELDMYATALQETGSASVWKLSVAEIAELAEAVGLDPKDVKVRGSLTTIKLEVGK